MSEPAETARKLLNIENYRDEDPTGSRESSVNYVNVTGTLRTGKSMFLVYMTLLCLKANIPFTLNGPTGAKFTGRVCFNGKTCYSGADPDRKYGFLAMFDHDIDSRKRDNESVALYTSSPKQMREQQWIKGKRMDYVPVWSMAEIAACYRSCYSNGTGALDIKSVERSFRRCEGVPRTIFERPESREQIKEAVQQLDTFEELLRTMKKDKLGKYTPASQILFHFVRQENDGIVVLDNHSSWGDELPAGTGYRDIGGYDVLDLDKRDCTFVDAGISCATDFIKKTLHNELKGKEHEAKQILNMTVSTCPEAGGLHGWLHESEAIEKLAAGGTFDLYSLSGTRVKQSSRFPSREKIPYKAGVKGKGNLEKKLKKTLMDYLFLASEPSGLWTV